MTNRRLYRWTRFARAGKPALPAMLLVLVLAVPLWGAPTAAETQAELDRKIATLVGQLGAPEYAAREKAQAELSRLGLEAFDALHQAQYHDDIEIALRARYLVRSMNVSWAEENDSPDVQKLLKGYGDEEVAERKNRMERLAGLENRQGLAALCRLVRFEPDNTLSKQAALLVLSRTSEEDVKDHAEMAQLITDTIGISKRTGADWLRSYAKTLEKPESSLAEWDAHTQAEQATFTQYPERTSREIVRDLYRWQVSLLQKLGRDQEAVAVMRRTIALLDGTQEQVAEIVDWLIHRQAWHVVKEIADRFPETFNDSPLLLYRLAETQLKQGETDQATETATRALHLKPENIDEHIRVAALLQERGLFDWAEREFRAVMKAGPVGSGADFRARLLLSEMLHDQAQELAAGDVLKPLVEAIDSDPNAQDIFNRLNREPGSIHSRMHYFYSRDFAAKGDHKNERDQLRKGIEKEKTDADVLIALYRLPNATPEEQAETKKLIEAAAGEYREDLETYRQLVEQAQNEQFQQQYSQGLAQTCNQLAWLVGNTFGDFDEAIRLSKRSLELRPDTAGHLDTLGRCYYAKGDLENAIKYQSQAVKLDPHSGQLRRQLALFEQEWAKQKQKQP